MACKCASTTEYRNPEHARAAGARLALDRRLLAASPDYEGSWRCLVCGQWWYGRGNALKKLVIGDFDPAVLLALIDQKRLGKPSCRCCGRSVKLRAETPPLVHEFRCFVSGYRLMDGYEPGWSLGEKVKWACAACLKRGRAQVLEQPVQVGETRYLAAYGRDACLQCGRPTEVLSVLSGQGKCADCVEENRRVVEAASVDRRAEAKATDRATRPAASEIDPRFEFLLQDTELLEFVGEACYQSTLDVLRHPPTNELLVRCIGCGLFYSPEDHGQFPGLENPPSPTVPATAFDYWRFGHSAQSESWPELPYVEAEFEVLESLMFDHLDAEQRFLEQPLRGPVRIQAVAGCLLLGDVGRARSLVEGLEPSDESLSGRLRAAAAGAFLAGDEPARGLAFLRGEDRYLDFARALLNHSLGQIEEARADYHRAVRASPSFENWPVCKMLGIEPEVD